MLDSVSEGLPFRETSRLISSSVKSEGTRILDVHGERDRCSRDASEGVSGTEVPG